jgi:hypothetical protein
MVATQTNARKFMKIYYEYSIPPTCFGHSCDLLKEVRHKIFYMRVLNREFLKLSILHLCRSQTSVICRRIRRSLGIPPEDVHMSGRNVYEVDYVYN